MYMRVLMTLLFVFFLVGGVYGAQREWTVLVYAVTDSFMADCFAADMKEMEAVGSSKQLEILVQLDKNDYHAKRYRVEKGYTRTLASLGQIPCGEAKTLVDFVKWGVTRAPSKRVMLILYGCVGHLGYGAPSRPFRSFLGTQSQALGNSFSLQRDMAKLGRDFSLGRENGARYFGIRHLGFALNNISKFLGRPIDIVGLDDSCNGTVEKLFEYRHYVSHWISSVGFIPSDDWPYEEVLSLLAVEPLMSNGEFCRRVVDHYASAYKDYCNLPYGFGATLTAYDLRQLEELFSALQLMAERLRLVCKKRPARLKILALRKKVLNFLNSDVLDLKQFVGGLQKLQLGDEELHLFCQRTLGLIKATQIAHWADGRHYKEACGTAVTVSEWMGGYDRKKYRLLKWSKYSRWNKFLDLLAKEFCT